MRLRAVANRKLYVQIADQIRDLILSGELRRGTQLPSERDLARSFGVSRPTVREALIALEVAGLVEVRVGVGAFVSGTRDHDAISEHGASPIEVMRVRRLLEPEAAALAARNVDRYQRARLEKALADMARQTRQGTWCAGNDRAFHMTIAEASANEVLRGQLEALWNMRTHDIDKRFHQHLADMSDVRERILRDHTSISRAIASRDSDTARHAMTAHLDFVGQAMVDVWE